MGAWDMAVADGILNSGNPLYSTHKGVQPVVHADRLGCLLQKLLAHSLKGLIELILVLLGMHDHPGDDASVDFVAAPNLEELQWRERRFSSGWSGFRGGSYGIRKVGVLP